MNFGTHVPESTPSGKIPAGHFDTLVERGYYGLAFVWSTNPLVTATATEDGGYTVNGRAPFVTGWGLIDVIDISAYDADAHATVTFWPTPSTARKQQSTALRRPVADQSHGATRRNDTSARPHSRWSAPRHRTSRPMS